MEVEVEEEVNEKKITVKTRTWRKRENNNNNNNNNNNKKWTMREIAHSHHDVTGPTVSSPSSFHGQYDRPEMM